MNSTNKSNKASTKASNEPVVISLATFRDEMLKGESQILSPIAEELKVAGVSIPAIISCRNTANAKRTLAKMEATNKSKSGWTDKGAEYKLASEEATPAEGRVKDFYAWQTAQLKMATQYGLPASWSLPPVMVAGLKACFPFIVKANKAKASKAKASEPETVPAPAPAPAPVS